MGTAIALPTRFRLLEILRSRTPPMSQRELARRSGVSLVTINAIANNRTSTVALSTLDALAEALNVGPGDLLERDEKKRRPSRGR